MTNETKKNGFPDRLKVVIGASGGTNKAFAKMCGMSGKQIQAYLAGDQEPGMKFFRGLKQAYPSINIDWLVSGQGEPWLDRQPTGAGCPPPETAQVIETRHVDVIRRFLDKGCALRINSNLADLERLNPEMYRRVGMYIEGSAETARVAAGEPQEQEEGGDADDGQSPQITGPAQTSAANK